MGETRIEPRARHHHADAIRPDQAHETGTRRLQGRPLQLLAARTQFAEARGNDHRRLGSARAKLRDQSGNRIGWGGDNGEIRSYRQAGHVGPCLLPVQSRMARIDRKYPSAEAGAADIAPQHPADRIESRRRADYRDRRWIEQLAEIPYGHWHPAPTRVPATAAPATEYSDRDPEPMVDFRLRNPRAN